MALAIITVENETPDPVVFTRSIVKFHILKSQNHQNSYFTFFNIPKINHVFSVLVVISDSIVCHAVLLVNPISNPAVKFLLVNSSTEVFLFEVAL